MSLEVCNFGQKTSVIRSESVIATVVEKTENDQKKSCEPEFTCVMKFGGSSVVSAERMKEVADLIESSYEMTSLIADPL